MMLTIFQNLDDALLQKAEYFILFGLSDNVQILSASGINPYHAIINRISDFQCQHYNGNKKYLIVTSLLLLTVEAQNICYF